MIINNYELKPIKNLSNENLKELLLEINLNKEIINIIYNNGLKSISCSIDINGNILFICQKFKKTNINYEYNIKDSSIIIKYENNENNPSEQYYNSNGKLIGEVYYLKDNDNLIKNKEI